MVAHLSWNNARSGEITAYHLAVGNRVRVDASFWFAFTTQNVFPFSWFSRVFPSISASLFASSFFLRIRPEKKNISIEIVIISRCDFKIRFRNDVSILFRLTLQNVRSQSSIWFLYSIPSRYFIYHYPIFYFLYFKSYASQRYLWEVNSKLLTHRGCLFYFSSDLSITIAIIFNFIGKINKYLVVIWGSDNFNF